LKAEVKVGDVVQAGVMISNSELGYGAVQVLPFFKRLVCSNGMAVPEKDTAIRRAHLGGRQLSDEPFRKLLIDGERKQASAAIWKAVGDSVGAVLDGSRFKNLVERMQAANRMLLSEEADKLVEQFGARFGLTQHEQKAVIEHYERDGERTLWGIANAVTRTANDLEDYGRATELETVGGRMLQ
jgi:hypothetical protein